nr:tetratricopeptide repeat protein [Candidatus Hydrogenedentota bacterium]
RWLPLIGIGLLVFLFVAGAGGLLYYLSQDPIAQAKKLAATNPLGAIAVLQKHTERHQEDREAFLALGKLQWQNQQFSNAATAFETASRLDPTDEEAAWLAVLVSGKNEKEQGRNALIADLRRIVENNPNNQQAWYMLALALGAINDPQGQTDALQKALALDPAHAPSRRMLGITFALQGDYPSAIEEFQKAEQLMPNDSDTTAALGMTYSLEGNIAEAVAALTEAIKQQTSLSTPAKMRLALLQLAQGNTEEALSLFREIKSATDATPDALFFYALCLQANKLDTEAITEFDRIANTNGPYAGEAAVQMALAYLQQENTDRAAEYVRRATQQGYSSAKLLTIQGRLELLRGDSNAAIQAFRNATQKEPDYAAAHLELGLAYVNRSSITDGIEELKRYLELIGANRAGTRAEEVELLVTQLQQASSSAVEDAAKKDGSKNKNEMEGAQS